MQAVLVGHCPGPVEREALRADEELAESLTQLGYGERVCRWQDDSDEPDELYLLPLPIRSLAQLQRLFPRMQLEDSRAVRQARQWLPWAVQDYFAAGGAGADDRLCWIIRVPEQEGVAGLDAFAPRAAAVRHDPEGWGALELACSVDDAGILVLADFERLLVPEQQRDMPRKRLPNAAIHFYPCTADLDDDHRERRYSDEIPSTPVDKQAARRIANIAARIYDWRPDLQWICALSPEVQQGLPLQRPQPELEEWLELQVAGSGNPALARVQLLFPLIYGRQRPLGSPSGVVAGHIVHRTRRDGVWRSVAGVTLARHLRPWPSVGRMARTRLREELGLGVLYAADGRMRLDDERLVSSGFCSHVGTACRSGELMRFIGWLKRSLRDLGEDMMFRLDGRDPAVRAMLDAFLNGLHQKGALRGRAARDAYRITRLGNRANEIRYRIEIAPSFPVDRLVVTFVHDRGANSRRWVWEGAPGD